MYLRLREQCLRSEITSVARVAHVLLLRFVAGNMDVNTLASKRSVLIRNTAIVRKCCVIHKKSTCVCLRLSVYAETQGRKVRPVAGLSGCGSNHLLYFTCIIWLFPLLIALPWKWVKINLRVSFRVRVRVGYSTLQTAQNRMHIVKLYSVVLCLSAIIIIII